MTTLEEDLFDLMVRKIIEIGEETKLEIQANIVAEDIIESGGLLNSITVHDIALTPVSAELTIRAGVGLPRRYASYQDQGTGIYAGNGRITKNAGDIPFHFFWRRMGGIEVFTLGYNGTPNTGFFSKAIAELKARILVEVWAAL